MNDPALHRHWYLLAVSLLTLLRKPLPGEIWPAVFDRCRSLTDRDAPKDLIEPLTDLIKTRGMNLPRGWPEAPLINRSIRQADQWADQGIGLIPGDQIPSQNNRPPHFPPFFFHIGRSDLLNHTKIAILNSRKSKELGPRDRWVRATKGLFDFLDQDQAAWVSSLGNYPYEMVCTLCADRAKPLILVLSGPLPEMLEQCRESSFYEQYGRMFPPENTLLLSAIPPVTTISSKDRQPIRDAAVAGLTDHIGVAEIRPGGNMERLALFAAADGKPVTVFKPRSFDRETNGNRKVLKAGGSPWQLPPSRLIQPIKTVRPSPANLTINPDAHLDGQFFVHFTRSCPGVWPGQDRFDYYRAIINDAPDAGHTALDTLFRILEEQKIRSQAGLVRGGGAVISFTAAGIMSARYLIQWRKGLVRWTFEPYGLAIHRRELSARGLKPVIYGDERVWKRLPRREKFRFQKQSAPHNKWLKEREWRMAGDLDLREIPLDRIMVIVCSPDEADTVRDRFGLPVLCLQAPTPSQTIGRA